MTSVRSGRWTTRRWPRSVTYSRPVLSVVASNGGASQSLPIKPSVGAKHSDDRCRDHEPRAPHPTAAHGISGRELPAPTARYQTEACRVHVAGWVGNDLIGQAQPLRDGLPRVPGVPSSCDFASRETCAVRITSATACSAGSDSAQRRSASRSSGVPSPVTYWSSRSQSISCWRISEIRASHTDPHKAGMGRIVPSYSRNRPDTCGGICALVSIGPRHL